ncbi:putative chromosome-partitioning protein ParB [Marine Group I thaumarchaeote SCGC AAA799-E16]|uniref:Putative chromosome-partitioning protein ParB n=4 Tax=Marine Group I TaxID=905826 RepID=A0A081RMT8_9ARCH|nr:putative chromosome-partitioning protein ParB [Marine Group I thaumarchaeote SCGC AAA799-N04]KER05627.1 putative chromosome-partitioning protein ParB [Marine Group I thaumarchaeote SCGC AAA799-E16]KFM15565.1 putative chromosome-partitioning protein ParB [Marine Group I thaumarchaeote SCGC AAA799-D11]KFM16765.1 putative chromosome-partitioning protein ParB [Marine Group I thaumarchaeote SCGC RSA3]
MVKRYKPTISYRLKEIPIKQIKVWKEAQARKLDRENISELAKSIKNEGLLNPPLVQKEGKNTFLLMSGQRRLAAMKRLGAKKIPVHVLTKQTSYDLENAKAASVVENIHRNDMNHKEIADSCKFLTEHVGKSAAARSMGMSPSTLNKYLGFAGVPDRLKALVPKEISRDEMTKLYLTIPNIKKAEKIVNRISKLETGLRKRYLRALSQSPKSSHQKLLKRAKNMRIKQNISIKLSKTNARKLASQSNKKELTPDEFAGKIISDYLKRKRR